MVMWRTRKRNIIVFLAKGILISLLLVFIIRCFFVESFSVVSTQMTASLWKGDRVFVNKTSYGMRMPVTVLSIPFTFDRFFGFLSYSPALQLPYTRVFSNEPRRNDVVLYNNPGEIDKPLDKRTLLLGRCVGLPGESIQAFDNRYVIDGREYTASPDMVQLYKFDPQYTSSLSETARREGIYLFNAGRHEGHTLLLMSKFDAYLINRNMSDSFDVLTVSQSGIYYDFIVPYKGMTIPLTPENLAAYGQAILAEMENRAGIIDGRLMIDYKDQASYTFSDNYYWMLCDNTVNTIDSRAVGFVPAKSLIGKASFIWFSRDERGVRYNRCFSKIE